MKTYKLKHKSTNKIYTVGIDLANYVNNNRLYIGLSLVRTGEIWDDITVNIPDQHLCSGWIIVKPDMLDFVQSNNIGNWIGVNAYSGYNTYPIINLSQDFINSNTFIKNHYGNNHLS